MSDVVIKVENLGKKYIIGHELQRQGQYVALRDVIADKAKQMLSFGRKNMPKHTIEEFWALQDVSFEVKTGERIGIIGRNGAGKSTLLKILSRITEPTKGKISIKGRMASLLEVGTGFHQELTGRENIYLNGAILGMSKNDIRQRFDEIVEFAEIENFLDTPVKRYSSGMYVRLAFAVAAHLETEILVLDEVLAVGDIEFQKKCFGKMEEVSNKEGKTVLFVSHNMEIVLRLCNKGILLDYGKIKTIGETSEVINEYLSRSKDGDLSIYTQQYDEQKEIGIVKAFIERDNKVIDEIISKESIEVVLEIIVKKMIRFSIEIVVRNEDRNPVFIAPLGVNQGIEFDVSPGKYICKTKLFLPKLAAGYYYLDLIIAESGIGYKEYNESALRFSVINSQLDYMSIEYKQSMHLGCSIIEGQSTIKNQQ